MAVPTTKFISSYFCPCLNVRLRITEDAQATVGSRPTTTCAPNDIDKNHNVDRFFNDVIFVNAPKGLTINKKLECLCRNRQANSWLIMTCINCATDTHAVLANDISKVYISSRMERDPAIETALTQLDTYSSAYEIVVRPFTANEGSASITGMPPLIDEPIGHQVDELKHKTAKYLDSEQETIRERIRNYEKEQLFKFKETETRILQDQSILMQRLKNVLQKEANTKQPGMQRAPTTVPSIQSTASIARCSSAVKYVNAALGKENTAAFSGNDRFDVFAMDEDEVFSLSEAESSDSNEDECPFDDAPQTTDVSNQLYATSLPISMPTVWKNSDAPLHVVDDNTHTPTSEKDNFKEEDPQWMAASIQAMARSVRGTDGTEMFGARPRPRLNTLD